MINNHWNFSQMDRARWARIPGYSIIVHVPGYINHESAIRCTHLPRYRGYIKLPQKNSHLPGLLNWNRPFTVVKCYSVTFLNSKIIHGPRGPWPRRSRPPSPRACGGKSMNQFTIENGHWVTFYHCKSVNQFPIKKVYRVTFLPN